MAKIKCKGTVLQQTLATVLTPVAQIIDLSGPDMEAETAECDTLDNSDAGIPYMSTGRTEGGSLSGNMFFDPALAGHTNILDLLTTPQSETWKLIFADTGTSEWDITGVGFSFSPTVALADGLKASFAIKLDGLPTFPGSGSAA
jgi:hypothetical protein